MEETGPLNSSPKDTMQYIYWECLESHSKFSSLLPRERAGAYSPSVVSITEEIAKPAERCLPAVIRP